MKFKDQKWESAERTAEIERLKSSPDSQTKSQVEENSEKTREIEEAKKKGTGEL